LQAASLEALGFAIPASAGQDQSENEATEAKVRHEIENGVHQFETLLEATIDKNFDKMEIFALRSIIAVPEDVKDWIRLRHYEGLNFNMPPDAPTLESITLQRRKFQESQRLHRLLEAEVARNASLIAQLKSVISNTSSTTVMKTEPSETDLDAEQKQPPSSLAFISQKGDLVNSSASTPLSTTTAFALSQLPSMRALLAELRPQMKTLASPQPPKDSNLAEGGEEGEPSWRRQRLEHVETLTKRFLVNERGLELGPQGEVRDGEWQEQGRRITRGEVEALEKVVSMISGDGKGNEMDEGA
jgi:kinetochore protein Mis12/MTW1